MELRGEGRGCTKPPSMLLHPHICYLWTACGLQVFGHIHDYEQYFPVANKTVVGAAAAAAAAAAAVAPEDARVRGGRPPQQRAYADPGAPVHVTTGAGGNIEMRGGAGAVEAPPQVRAV